MELRDCQTRGDRIAAFLEADGEIVFEDLQDLAEGAFAIAGKVALPCSRAARYGVSEESPILDIPIALDGEQIGYLCLSSRLKDAGVQLAAITEVQRHALLRLASPSDFEQGGDTLLKQEFDCVVVERDHLGKFLEKQSTSALWGGFVLALNEIPMERSLIEAGAARINVLDLESPRTIRHRAALQRSTETSVATDRFLHLYHFLELDYDHEIIERISRIDRENTKGLEKLLGTGRTELERLLLVCEGFSDIHELEQIASSLRNHRETALAVFYTYGKDRNPLRDQVQFEKQFLDPAAITRPELDAIKDRYGLGSNFAKDDRTYQEMLLKLACYWIYRIRCCVAHNKLGEYHLSSAADMRFIAEFGEPLIKALVVHRLTPRTAP